MNTLLWLLLDVLDADPTSTALELGVSRRRLYSMKKKKKLAPDFSQDIRQLIRERVDTMPRDNTAQRIYKDTMRDLVDQIFKIDSKD